MFDWVSKLALVGTLIGLALVISVELYPSAQWGDREMILLSLGGALIWMALLVLGLRNSIRKDF